MESAQNAKLIAQRDLFTQSGVGHGSTCQALLLRRHWISEYDDLFVPALHASFNCLKVKGQISTSQVYMLHGGCFCTTVRGQTRHFWVTASRTPQAFVFLKFRAEASVAVSILLLFMETTILEPTRSGFKIQQQYRKTAGPLTFIHVCYHILPTMILMFSHSWLDGKQSAQVQVNASSSYSSRDPKLSML